MKLNEFLKQFPMRNDIEIIPNDNLKSFNITFKDERISNKQEIIGVETYDKLDTRDDFYNEVMNSNLNIKSIRVKYNNRMLLSIFDKKNGSVVNMLPKIINNEDDYDMIIKAGKQRIAYKVKHSRVYNYYQDSNYYHDFVSVDKTEFTGKVITNKPPLEMVSEITIEFKKNLERDREVKVLRFLDNIGDIEMGKKLNYNINYFDEDNDILVAVCHEFKILPDEIIEELRKAPSYIMKLADLIPKVSLPHGDIPKIYNFI